MATGDEQLPTTIVDILNSPQSEGKYHLNAQKIRMFMLSEIDIEQGNLISEDDLYEMDSEWMS